MKVRIRKYRRVSTEEQAEGYSLEAQDRAIDGFIAQKRETEWEVISIKDYITEGASARTEDLSKRPAFKQMIDDALSGRLDVIIVHKLDRFSRNLLVTLTYFRKLSQAGVAFVSVSEQMDFSTPIGRMMLAVLGAVAQWYSDNLSQETKKGKQERAYQGLYNGCLPYGYVKGKDGVPVVVEEEAEAIRLAYVNYATGKYSLDQVASILNTKGYRTRARGKKPLHLWSGDTRALTRSGIDAILSGLGSYGGDDGIRTRDLLLDRQVC